GTTPSYQVSGPNGLLLPINNMPGLLPGDQISFVFNTISPNGPDRKVFNCSIYTRPLADGLGLSPFSQQPTSDNQYAIESDSVFTVATVPGGWNFTLQGFYSTPNSENNGSITVPFLVDPEADVGTGVT
ncbi:MAG: hypothetical protein KGM99_02495, partial [Burkholderiales bacterium]|nr:hypothetical protein [Burkholderiales bacterium]